MQLSFSRIFKWLNCFFLVCSVFDITFRIRVPVCIRSDSLLHSHSDKHLCFAIFHKFSNDWILFLLSCSVFAITFHIKLPVFIRHDSPLTRLVGCCNFFVWSFAKGCRARNRASSYKPTKNRYTTTGYCCLTPTPAQKSTPASASAFNNDPGRR